MKLFSDRSPVVGGDLFPLIMKNMDLADLGSLCSVSRSFNFQINEFCKKKKFCREMRDLGAIVTVIKKWELYPEDSCSLEQLCQKIEKVLRQFENSFPFKIKNIEDGTSSRLNQLQIFFDSLGTSSDFGVGNKQLLMWQVAEQKQAELAIALASDEKIMSEEKLAAYVEIESLVSIKRVLENKNQSSGMKEMAHTCRRVMQERGNFEIANILDEFLGPEL